MLSWRGKMDKYKIEVKLMSEAIFGSGHSIPGSVDLEIVYDDNGFPFMKAKTFKGNLREAMENAVTFLGSEYSEVMNGLVGKEGNGVELWKTLKFSDCMISKNVREFIEIAVKEKVIQASEVKDALTSIRSFTSIDEDGSHKIGSLRQFRVISKGLVFEVEVECERKLEVKELELLALSVKSLKHIGSMRTRGKGRIDCRLLANVGECADITDFYINRLLKGVGANV